MRAIILGLSCAALALGMPASPVAAQEGGATPESVEQAHARAVADLGAHYLAASEAKLAEGRALLAAGKMEPGLAVLRQIADLLARHETLVLRGAVPAPAPVAPPPPVVEAPAPPATDAPVPPGRVAAAIERSLRWLADHQDPEGRWSCDNFQRCCKKNICEGKGASDEYSTGTTALALVAFLGAGNTTRSGAYQAVVDRAVKHLVSIQAADGCIGPRVGSGHFFYGHAIATLALAEAYGLSGQSPHLGAPAQKAVDFLMTCQNPYLGWRYGVKPGDNDSSCTAWAVLALKSATLSGLSVPPEGFAGAKNWFDKVTDESFYKTGYTQKGDNGARLPEAQRYAPAEAMTAAAVACRIFMGAKVEDPVVKGGATLLKNMPPRWDANAGNDFYYWYFGTLATFQVGGDAWRVWSRGLQDAVVRTQRRGGDENGSWDPADAWGAAGGRVYSTAINTLSLEVYARAAGAGK